MTVPAIVRREIGASLAVQHDLTTLAEEWRIALDLRVRAGELADSSRNTYQIGMQKFITWRQEHSAHMLSDDTIREWIADLRERGQRPGAINTWLAGLRAFFTWAVSARRLPYNPADGVKGAQRKGTSRRHAREPLTDREVRRVLEQPDSTTGQGKRDRAILSLMAYTAARSIELHRADLSDLKTENGRLVLHVQGKGHGEADELIVIAHPDAESAMHDWLAARGGEQGPLFVSLSPRSKHERLSLRAIRDLVKDYYKAAGVHGKRKTTHSLRHTAITNAVRHGAPVQKVQSMARHANISTTMIYYHEQDRIENPAEDFIRYDEVNA